MKKGLLVAIAVVAVAAAAIAGLSWTLGGQAEGRYREIVDGLSVQGVRVVDSRYERGWFSSSATFDLVATPPPGGAPPVEEPRLHIASRIDHGPWSLAIPRPMPAIALIATRMELPVAGLNLPPLLLTTAIELDGSGVTQLHLPAGGGDGLEIAPGRGEVRFGPRLASGWFELPAVDMAADGDVRIALRGLRTEGSGTRWIDELFTGTGSLRLGELRVQAPDAELLASGIAITAENVPDGGFMNARVEYRVEGLEVNGAQYAPSVLAISVSRLPAEELASLQQALREVTAKPVTGPMAELVLWAILASHLPPLLASDPGLALDRLEVTTPQGQVEGHLALATRGLTHEILERPGAWIGHLVGEAELSLPRTLLIEALANRQRQEALAELRQRAGEGATLSAPIEGEIAQAAQERLAGLVRDGWVVEREGRAMTAIKLADALLTVNGKPMPLGLGGAP